MFDETQLRDYFAAKALPRFISHDRNRRAISSPDEAASQAYAYADAMMNARLAAPPAPSVAEEASDLEALLADITAIDTWHRGSPTYEHDAGWFKDRVVRLIEKRIKR